MRKFVAAIGCLAIGAVLCTASASAAPGGSPYSEFVSIPVSLRRG